MRLTRKGETQPRRVFSAALQATRPESERALARASHPAWRDCPWRIPTGGDRAGRAREFPGFCGKDVLIPARPAWLGSKAGGRTPCFRLSRRSKSRRSPG